MEKLTLRDLDLQGKRVLMRVDFNVPLSKDGKIADDSRIEASLPSIRYVLKQGGRLILMSHLGRPDGKADPKCSLSICAKRLSELLGENVKMAPESVGPEVEKMALELKSGEVMLLENLRFHPGEEKPESEKGFVEGLAKLGQVYVNDAFGTAHRAHASTAKIASFFPGKAAAGFLMEKEVSMLGNLLQHPKKPFYAIIGGSKVSTKIGAIKNLLSRIDALFIGGGMAYTFLKAQGFRIGDSLCEEGEVKLAQQILAECKKKKIPCHLPIDLVIADAFSNEAARQIVDVYREQEGFVNLGSASQRKIDPNERDHCTSCKASEEDRFYAGVANPNSQNLPARGIKVPEADLVLRLRDLKKCFSSPWKFYLEKKLNIYFEEFEEEDWSDFEMSPLQRSQLLKEGLSSSIEPVLDRLEKKHLLPAGLFGKVASLSACRIFEEWKGHLDSWDSSGSLKELIIQEGTIQIPFGEKTVHLIGMVRHVSSKGAIHFGEDSFSSLLKNWPEHLAALTALQSNEIFCIRSGKLKLVPDPKAALKECIKLYLLGLETPLPIVSEWVDALVRKGDAADLEKKINSSRADKDEIYTWVLERSAPMIAKDLIHTWRASLQESLKDLLTLYPVRAKKHAEI